MERWAILNASKRYARLCAGRENGRGGAMAWCARDAQSQHASWIRDDSWHLLTISPNSLGISWNHCGVKIIVEPILPHAVRYWICSFWHPVWWALSDGRIVLYVFWTLALLATYHYILGWGFDVSGNIQVQCLGGWADFSLGWWWITVDPMPFFGGLPFLSGSGW